MKKILLSNDYINAIYDIERGGFISLKSHYDAYETEFLLTPDEFPEYDVDDCQWLGNISGKVFTDNSELLFSTGTMKKKSMIEEEDSRITITYPTIYNEKNDIQFSLKSEFSMDNEMLSWTIFVKNESLTSLVFTDVNIPLLMNQFFRNDDNFKYDKCVLRHSCIVGHSSYLYWEKSSGNGPVLLLAPTGASVLTDLRKEDRNTIFGPRGGEGRAYEGMVRTYLVSEESPIPFYMNKTVSVDQNDEVQFQITLSFLEREENINDTLDSLSLATLKAVPGMVGPIDDYFYIMTRPLSADVLLCDPEDKIIISEEKNGWKVTKLKFGTHGRRYINVKNNDSISSYCFFVTEPINDIIDDHAKFIAQKHIENDPKDPCYHAFLMWDMINKCRINSTFNPYYEDWWRGGSDDPGLASGLFLSEKNVYRPNDEEIEALNAYVEDFLIARLTEQPGWRVHRMVPWYMMFEPWSGRGADDVWRAFNYVHIINTMRNMYKIKKLYQYDQLRSATEYLLMAYEYTKAMFNYWMYPDGVGASEYGNMGEMTLPLYLDKELKEEGYIQEAAEMAAIFDKKSHFFNSKKYPFGSEMAYDSTAFEAVYSYGKRINSDHVMKASAKASYSNRGKQPVWYLYCTDIRAGGDTSWNSSYMTQLGAYPILDYTLDEGHIDEDWIMAYFGAYLSGWLLYNSGGYWNSDPENRGATGWITIGSLINFSGQKFPHSMPLLNGLVALSGEAGIGFFGALRTACSIVFDHSILGRIGLGCNVKNKNSNEIIKPNDGLSTRFFHVPLKWRVEIDSGYIDSIEILEHNVKLNIQDVKAAKLTVKVYTIKEYGNSSACLLNKTCAPIANRVKVEFCL